MLNSRFKVLIEKSKAFTYRRCLWFSSYNVKEVRGDYLYVVEDRDKQLDYMREIETEDGRRGIVLQIEQPSSTYVAMYEPIPKVNQNSFKLKESSISWQLTSQNIRKSILNKTNQSIFDVNGRTLFSSTHKVQINKESTANRKLLSLSPILDICHELQYGEMYNFSGCYGSRKTTTLTKILTGFNSKQKHLSLYFNPTSYSETQKVLQESGSWGFNNGNLKIQEYTDIGIYMLALKTIHLAKIMSKQGWNVLLGIDNFKSLLQAEWHMLQLLTNVSKRKSQEFINYSAPKISPISIINEIYASCNDFQRSKGKKSSGSFTSVLITQNNNKSDDQTPQITPYTNNIKHLSSLSHNIEFPLSIKFNYKTNTLGKVSEEKSIDYYLKTVRKHINEYIREKQESELKRKLYKSDMHDAPWDYYAMLDCEWWLKGIQTSKVSSEGQLFQFLKWIVTNIDHELVSHWKISCSQAFAHYNNFVSQQHSGENSETFQKFIGWAKLQGYFSPFKKDYLN